MKHSLIFNLAQVNGRGLAGECPVVFMATKIPAADARCYRVAGAAIGRGCGMVSHCVSLQWPAGGVG